MADIQANIQRLADLGLQVNISEMDVRVKDVAGDAAAKLARQRQVYRDVVAACVAVPRCEAVTLWGFTDAHSWIDSAFGADDPLALRRAVPGQARLLRRRGRVPQAVNPRKYEARRRRASGAAPVRLRQGRAAGATPATQPWSLS